MWTQQLEIIAEVVTKKLAESGHKFSFAKAESLIGVSKNKWVAWSKGQRPNAEDLAKISKSLNISAHWLLFGEGSISNDPRDIEVDPDILPFAKVLEDILNHDLTTTPENFAEIGGITPDELTAMLQGKMLPPASALRNWAIRYRVNLNFLVAQIGYPLLTRGQYEQKGPLTWLRKERKEHKYPLGCGNPSNAEAAESIDSDLYDGEPYQPDRHVNRIPDVTPGMIPPGRTMPLVGLAECGLEGWSTQMQMAATTLVPEFHDEIIAAMTIGDSMEPAGIMPGNIVYCDPRLKPKEGDIVYVSRSQGSDGTATVKIYQGEEGDWLKLYGWLPKKHGEAVQKDFCMKEPMEFVDVIAPVVMIRKRSE